MVGNNCQRQRQKKKKPTPVCSYRKDVVYRMPMEPHLTNSIICNGTCHTDCIICSGTCHTDGIIWNHTRDVIDYSGTRHTVVSPAVTLAQWNLATRKTALYIMEPRHKHNIICSGTSPQRQHYPKWHWSSGTSWNEQHCNGASPHSVSSAIGPNTSDSFSNGMSHHTQLCLQLNLTMY